MKKIISLFLCIAACTTMWGQTPKFQASVTSGTINVTATINDDYTAELTLPQDNQYIGHNVEVSVGFNGAKGLGIADGTSRSFSKSLDLTPYLKGYIGTMLENGDILTAVVNQLEANITSAQLNTLVESYKDNLSDSKINEIIDGLTITETMMNKVIPNPLTKDVLDEMVSVLTLTTDQQNAYDNWASLSTDEQNTALAEIRAKIVESLGNASVQAKLKEKLKTYEGKKDLATDYIDGLGFEEKRDLVFGYIKGLGYTKKLDLIKGYVEGLTNETLGGLIDTFAASMELNAEALLQKACEFAGVGTAWIAETLNPIYNFTTTTANVKVVDGVKTEGFAYTVTGDKNGGSKNVRLTAAPDNFGNAQAAWAMVAEHLKGTTQTTEDTKVVISKGTYVQFGDQRLKFIKDCTLLEGGAAWNSVEAIKSNATDLYAKVLDAVEIENTNMETSDAAQTYIVSAFMPKGSAIHFGSSVLTLKDDMRVELDAAEAAAAAGDVAKEALSQEISELRQEILNSAGKRAKVKAAAKYGVGMFVRALKIAESREVDLRIIFAPDCDVDKDGRVTIDDAYALVDNVLNKDTEEKNDHETNIDENESAVQSIGDLTKLISVLKTLAVEVGE